jgi:hypothetical protein
MFFFMFFSLSRSTCHSTLDTRPFSRDYFIRPREHFGRNCQADLFRVTVPQSKIANPKLLLTSNFHRDRDRKPRSFSFFALDDDIAAHEIREFLDDG